MIRRVVTAMAVVLLALATCTACAGSASDPVCGETTPDASPMSPEEADKAC
jgi:hypothetical protein